MRQSRSEPYEPRGYNGDSEIDENQSEQSMQKPLDQKPPPPPPPVDDLIPAGVRIYRLGQSNDREVELRIVGGLNKADIEILRKYLEVTRLTENGSSSVS